MNKLIAALLVAAVAATPAVAQSGSADTWAHVERLTAAFARPALHPRAALGLDIDAVRLHAARAASQRDLIAWSRAWGRALSDGTGGRHAPFDVAHLYRPRYAADPDLIVAPAEP